MPIPYFHTVLTLPHELNLLILGNQHLLLGLLLRAASETLLQFGHQNLGGQLGAIMVLHTWDHVLKVHFYLHVWCLAVRWPQRAHAGRRPPKFLFLVKALVTAAIRAPPGPKATRVRPTHLIRHAIKLASRQRGC